MKFKTSSIPKKLLECLNSCHATAATYYMCQHVRVVCVCVCVCGSHYSLAS